MEKPSARKGKKEATYNSVFEDEDFIICRKVDFQHCISTLLYYAWKHRNSESHLYALYSYIQTLQSLTLLHKTQPARAIAPWPQPLFGTLDAPKGVINYPSPNARLPSNYYPDHARIMIFGSKEQGLSYSLEAHISTALDSSEAKVLNIPTPWNLTDSKRAAEKIAKIHVAQVCESSLAGLAHNPFWPSLYAFLLVGPYFSLFAWKTRPNAEHLESLPELPSVPQHVKSKSKEALTAKRKEVVEQRIDRIKKTPLPEVIYYNEPMFTFKQSNGQKWYEKATLSPRYLHALSLPASALSEELACQPSWFGVGDSKSFVESNRRVNVQQVRAMVLLFIFS
ncbi:hypothetical protein LXA43DRAFT_1004487 [Ganoderma leucocontextum]|nr:hypothetical protein LXA43DRAFT_1004487 [Ganoderma leucocontextum]